MFRFARFKFPAACSVFFVVLQVCPLLTVTRTLKTSHVAFRLDKFVFNVMCLTVIISRGQHVKTNDHLTRRAADETGTVLRLAVAPGGGWFRGCSRDRTLAHRRHCEAGSRGRKRRRIRFDTSHLSTTDRDVISKLDDISWKNYLEAAAR